MTDAERLSKFLAQHKITRADVAALWGGAIDDVEAVLTGDAELTGRHRALLVLFGGSHKSSRESAIRHLRDAEAEVWRTIPGFSRYEASSRGRIRRAAGGLRVLKQTPRPDGYLRVTLYGDNGGMQTVQVHRAVCLAFHGQAATRQACHRDGDHLNNRPSNLYWGTARDNALDRVRHDAADPMRRLRKLAKLGEKTGTRLSKASVRQLFSAGLINKDKALALLGR